MNIGDVVFTIAYLFTGGDPSFCFDEADVNADNKINIADVSHVVAYLFTGGPPPICGSTTLALHSGIVTPGNGVQTDPFTYQVIFTDTLGNPPSMAEVFVNDVAQPMSMTTGAFLTGATYEYQSTAPIGQNAFYYRFITSSNDTLFFPPVGFDIGPAVTADTSVIIAENAVVMDLLPGLSLSAINGTQYSFNLSGAPPALSIGDIIVGEDTLGGSGYLRKVTTAYVDGGRLVVETKNAAVDEIILNGGLSDIIMVFDESNLRRRTSRVIEQTTEVFLAPGVTFSNGFWDLSGVELYSGPVGPASLTATITSGSITFNPTFDYEINFKPLLLGLADFRGIANGTFTANATVALSSTGCILSFSGERTLAEVRKKFKFLVGHVPVWLETIARINAGFSTSIEGSQTVSSGVTQTTNILIGVTYDGNEWAGVWNPNAGPIVPLPVEWDASADASAELFLRPEIALLLYSTLGLSVAAGPFARLEADALLSESQFCWKWELYAGVNGVANINASLLGKKFFDRSFPFSVTESIIASGRDADACDDLDGIWVGDLLESQADGGDLVGELILDLSTSADGSLTGAQKLQWFDLGLRNATIISGHFARPNFSFTTSVFVDDPSRPIIPEDPCSGPEYLEMSVSGTYSEDTLKGQMCEKYVSPSACPSGSGECYNFVLTRQSSVCQ
ncbi:MAG: hypothetical protein IH914_05155 [candidate division Zixibacteria bacterium]|nr:hypothetical protein [candidate division Zixibacteria bacterium]